MGSAFGSRKDPARELLLLEVVEVIGGAVETECLDVGGTATIGFDVGGFTRDDSDDEDDVCCSLLTNSGTRSTPTAEAIKGSVCTLCSNSINSSRSGFCWRRSSKYASLKCLTAASEEEEVVGLLLVAVVILSEICSMSVCDDDT